MRFTTSEHVIVTSCKLLTSLSTVVTYDQLAPNETRECAEPPELTEPIVHEDVRWGQRGVM